MPSDTLQNGPDLWLDCFPFPKPEGHKYDRGQALIRGGEIMTGAARLAARAAQRMGAGLVTLAASAASLPIYASALESVIVRESDTLASWKELLADPKRNAILIGPGLGRGEGQKDFVLAALETKKTCVLDADALTSFADQPEKLFSALHAGCVLTPHEGEFAKLFSMINPEEDKTARARKAASLAHCVVLLKGHETVIASPEGKAVLNSNAPAWLATAGAGDVLAGMILGLAAQHMPVFHAACAAAWLHGKIAQDFGPGLIAEDIIAGIPGILGGLSEAAQKE